MIPSVGVFESPRPSFGEPVCGRELAIAARHRVVTSLENVSVSWLQVSKQVHSIRGSGCAGDRSGSVFNRFAAQETQVDGRWPPRSRSLR